MRFIDLKTTIYMMFYTIFKDDIKKKKTPNYLQLLEEGRMKSNVAPKDKADMSSCMKT